MKIVEEMGPQYQGRTRVNPFLPEFLLTNNLCQLASACLEFLRANGYPKRYQDLIDPKATSDDEPSSTEPQVRSSKEYHIRKWPEHSPEFEVWIRLLDKKREEEARLDPKRKWHEHVRVVPEVQKATEFPALPLGMPIDYFNPGFFNQLQP